MGCFRKNHYAGRLAKSSILKEAGGENGFW